MQAFSLLILDPSIRPHSLLGASPTMFTRIVGGNVILGALLGRTPAAVRPGTEFFFFLFCMVMMGSAFAAVCFFKSNIEMKLFLVFSGMLLAASLLSPATYPPKRFTVWELLAQTVGARYWFFPSLAFAWTLLWCAHKGNAVLKWASIFLLCLMCLSAVRNWRRPDLRDLDFADYARRFQNAPAGTVMIIPENPDGWNIRLVKHASF